MTIEEADKILFENDVDPYEWVDCDTTSIKALTIKLAEEILKTKKGNDCK